MPEKNIWTKISYINYKKDNKIKKSLKKLHKNKKVWYDIHVKTKV